MGLFFIKILTYSYICLLLLLTIGAINFNFLDFIIIFIFTFLMIGSIALGFSESRKLPNLKVIDKKEISKSTFLFMALLAMGLSIYSSYFYTGNIFEGYKNLLSGDSNYANYQTYFSENEIAIFSINKIPAILSSAYVKIFYFFSLYQVIFTRRNKFNVTMTLLAIIGIVHSGINRGTFYEFFEIFLFFIFIYLWQKKHNGSKIKIKSMIYICLTLSLLFLLYNFNIDLRYAASGGYTPDCNSSMCFDESSLVNSFSPSLAETLYKLNGYFSFGYLYLSKLIIYLFSNHIYSIFLPSSFYDESISARFLCEINILNCAAMWSPSAESYIINFSFLGFFIVLFFYGYWTSILTSTFKQDPHFYIFILIYLNFLILFSLPIGNLFSTSSANLIIYFISIIFLIFRRVTKQSQLN